MIDDAYAGKISLLPVYLLLDVSRSMAGSPTGAIQCELDAILDELDGRTVGRMRLGIVAFGDVATTVIPLADLSDIDGPVKLPNCGSGTNYKAALEHLTDVMLEDSERLATGVSRKVEAPLVLFITDGDPNTEQDWRGALVGLCTTADPTIAVIGIGESSAETLRDIVAIAGGRSTALLAADGLPFIPVVPPIIAAAASPIVPADSGLRRIA